MATADLPVFRVFLSSPGDVPEERALALELLSELNSDPEFNDLFAVRISAWDDPNKPTPMDVTRTPQLAVVDYNVRPSECELTVIVLYGRLGTVLPPDVRRPDQSAYPSGTAWEVEDARAAGRPAWVYRRKGLKLDPDDPLDTENRAQHEKLKQYLQTFTAANGALLGGINTYAAPDEFKRLLRDHVKAELRRRAKASGAATRTGFRIFLSDVPEVRRSWRTRLKSDLKAVPSVEILDDVPPPLEYEAHALRVREDAKRADLCVHLLDAAPGALIEDAEDGTLTYPVEQLRICFEHARSQLVLSEHPLNPQGLSGAYRGLVDELLRSEHSQARLQTATTSRSTLLTRVVDQMNLVKNDRAAKQPDRSGSAQIKAFVDVHERDSQESEPLLKFLSESSIHVFGLGNRAATALERAAFEALVSLARYLIVVAGNVNGEWVESRLDEAAKINAELDLGIRFGIYVRPGGPEWSGAAPDGCSVINNSSGWDERPIRAFLSGARP